MRDGEFYADEYFNPGERYNKYQMIRSAQRNGRSAIIHPHAADYPYYSPQCEGSTGHTFIDEDGTVREQNAGS